MKFIKGDMWKYFGRKNVAIVVTTNGTVKSNGECVMGRGVAKDVRDMIPGFAKLLGLQIDAWGNRLQC